MKIKIDTMKAYISRGGLIGIIDDTVYIYDSSIMPVPIQLADIQTK